MKKVYYVPFTATYSQVSFQILDIIKQHVPVCKRYSKRGLFSNSVFDESGRRSALSSSFYLLQVPRQPFEVRPQGGLFTSSRRCKLRSYGVVESLDGLNSRKSIFLEINQNHLNFLGIL